MSHGFLGIGIPTGVLCHTVHIASEYHLPDLLRQSNLWVDPTNNKAFLSKKDILHDLEKCVDGTLKGKSNTYKRKKSIIITRTQINSIIYKYL